jgi:hypothetical protein
LYRIVSKFNPIRFGNRKLFRVKSHVPSPTCIVLEEYDADPGGDRVSAGAMMARGSQQSLTYSFLSEV